ncbi:MAG TPA: DUF6531 domain-containing protein [Candidatus Elarobacter sp.]|jgi:YD repeat-containing protein
MGNALVNVANGNLLLQTTDLAIPHFGLDLVVDREYNSTSQYDVNDSDGSQPSVFGNGWTSSLDAHIALNASGGISIFDGKGTRWDYAPDGSGGWILPPGQYGRLWYSASNAEYYWTFKDGMVYQFRSPTCSVAAVCGRIHYIYARNNNQYLHYAYGFSSTDNAFSHMSAITVTTEAGLQLYCFINSISGHPLVTQIAPYNTTTGAWQTTSSVNYTYDSAGNLVSYSAAANNDAGTSPVIGYNYYPGGHLLYQVTSPLYANGHGAYIQFLYNAGAVSEVDEYAEVNPTLSDGVSTGPIQSGATGVVRYNAIQYQYSAGTTSITDSDGHQRRYQINADGTTASRSVYTGSTWLTTSKVWDANHNTISVTDARVARTDFEYDSFGNIVTQAAPSTTAYSGGSHSPTTMRATTRAVYDAYNNVVAICGPAWNHAHNSDYGAANNCAAGAAGVTTFTWQWVETEQNSRLQTMTDPNNYHYTWSYDPSAQGGTDYSLPTEIKGDVVAQPQSPTQSAVTPDQQMSYDAYGNMICYNDGVGVTAFVYDAMNRLTRKSDPDDNLSACGRTPGTYQTSLFKSYYPNGQVKALGAAVPHAAAQDDAFTYDRDGNEVTSTNYENNRANLTTKFYDGADRLVEVALPHTTAADPVPDALATQWITRYQFDNTGGQALSEPGIPGTFNAFGNLYKIQEYQFNQFSDIKVVTYDPADRSLASYAHVPGTVPGLGTSPWRSQSNAYDLGAPGRLTWVSDSGGNSEHIAYDTAGRVASVQFTSAQTATPSRTYGYDEEGRVALTRSGTWGDEWSIYDPYTGRLLSRTEGNQGGVTSPGTFSYTYLADGRLRGTSFSGSAFSSPLRDQWYNANGSVAGEHFYNQMGTVLDTVTTTTTVGGRLLNQSDTWYANARSVSLDGWGRPQTIAMPSGSYSNITYDNNGNVAGFIAMSGHALTNTYNGRNELTSSAWTTSVGTIDVNYPNSRAHGANGVMLHDTYQCTNTTPRQCGWTDNADAPDLLGGAITSSDPAAFTGTPDFPATFSYDAAGRLSQNTQTFQAGLGQYVGTANKTYDAEDRLTSDAYSDWSNQTNGVCGARTTPSSPSASFTYTYDWGANGHPVRFHDSRLGTTETLHWDGDQLAFTTSASGQLDDLKYGNDADLTPLDTSYRGLTVWDRDPFGAIASSHNSTGHATWTAAGSAHNGCALRDAPPDSQGFQGPASFGWTSGVAYRYKYNGLLVNLASDGFSDDFNKINGVRTLTDSNSSWTVPDTFAGVPSAPATQKSYVYAADNPASNEDPSGFLSASQQAQMGAYFRAYQFGGGHFDCTAFVVQAYAQGIHIDLRSLVSEDYYGPRGPLSALEKGYDLNGYRSGHPELWVPNLHQYFQRMGELHAWQGNNGGSQVADVLFVGPARTSAGVTWIDIDHLAVVMSVDSSGRITKIAEGTGDGGTKVRTWAEFVKAMEEQHLAIADYARVELQFAMLVAASYRASQLTSDEDPYAWTNAH